MTDYEIIEISNYLQSHGFSVNASAAIIMWSKYHNDLKSPYFFLSGDMSVYDAANKFITEFDIRYDSEKVIASDGYLGNLDLSDGIPSHRFKSGFIDVMSLAHILEHNYNGGDI